MSSEFLYIGHRGTRAIFDENTISAFVKAIELGANCIEFDVRETKDGKLIILHDKTLDRTTTGSGLLRNFNYSKIKEYRTKNHNERIPLMGEVLNFLKGKTQFMIELKDKYVKDGILKIINHYELLEDCIFSGRDLQELGNIKDHFPNSRICYNITKGLDFKINDFLKFGKIKKLTIKPDLISLRSNLVTKDFIQVCHKNNIKSLSWDFLSYDDARTHIKSLIVKGIDGILFDDHRNIAVIKHSLGLGWFNPI